MTQPQGHSTSGSQERYKSAERLQWEADHDCLPRMRAWIIATELATEEQLAAVEETARRRAEEARRKAWTAFLSPVRREVATLVDLLEGLAPGAGLQGDLHKIGRRLSRIQVPVRKDIMIAIRDALLLLRAAPAATRERLIAFRDALDAQGRERYSSHLSSTSAQAAVHVPAVPARLRRQRAQCAGQPGT